MFWSGRRGAGGPILVSIKVACDRILSAAFMGKLIGR